MSAADECVVFSSAHSEIEHIYVTIIRRLQIKLTGIIKSNYCLARNGRNQGIQLLGGGFRLPQCPDKINPEQRQVFGREIMLSSRIEEDID